MKKCSVLGCLGLSLAKGYCKKHYQRFVKYGDPNYLKLSRGEGNTPEQRFWDRVGGENENGCMEWKRRRNKLGYGTCNSFGEYLAHRVAWKLHSKQLITEGMVVMHRCDNPPCCNPQHLRLGTNKDNTHDQYSKGRGVYLKGEKNGMAKLNYYQVLEIREKLSTGNFTYKQLSLQYGVSHYMIGRINRRESRK